MFSIAVTGSDITGTHIGPSLPKGNIEVSDITYKQIHNLQLQLQAEGRQGAVQWDGETPSIPVESRPLLSVTVNGSASVVVSVGDVIVLQVTGQIPDGALIVPVFGRRFKLDFIGGVASKNITITESRLYEIKSNEMFQVAEPVTIEAVE